MSEPAIEEALYDISLYFEFLHLDSSAMRLSDESTILRFSHLLEENKRRIQLLVTINDTVATKERMRNAGTAVDVELIAAPSSPKNSSGERDPKMHQTKKVNQWHFGMQALFGMDAKSSLRYGQAQVVFADAGYEGASNWPEASGV